MNMGHMWYINSVFQINDLHLTFKTTQPLSPGGTSFHDHFVYKMREEKLYNDLVCAYDGISKLADRLV